MCSDVLTWSSACLLGTQLKCWPGTPPLHTFKIQAQFPKPSPLPQDQAQGEIPRFASACLVQTSGPCMPSCKAIPISQALCKATTPGPYEPSCADCRSLNSCLLAQIGRGHCAGRGLEVLQPILIFGPSHLQQCLLLPTPVLREGFCFTN